VSTVTQRLDDLLAEARARLGTRPGPAEAARLLAEGALLVDIRPVELRRRDGEVPGAVIVDRNVLEWRLAPTSAHRLPDAGEADRTVVVVCNEGYASSLAAVALRELGLRGATDLDGGFQAWAAAGLPVSPGAG
jgi:rhodanese-related sulfurtransferase